MATLELIGCFALTEPNHGSDSAALETSARLEGDHYEGYTPTLITGKIGKRAVWQPDTTIENVRIPVENRLSKANSFSDVNIVLAATSPTSRRSRKPQRV